ncbi:hypothetical protein [Hyperthermus butylicus]|uniref:Uncharacterized protein n=1 Tax=Hyperthermus butylicus (strain DSM 5456 / JCM 9403 / PLM1-5) TaxID=415426 RepID=A2BMI1_HYPBU|nr:hypothetical protein [Hyperthermus butylicus]ABM81192.1 hypothetical protein Hbut_1367 [Hyperthermus butylicus DSM 5456]
MASEETWRSIPLYYAIVEELERRGGNAKDIELYRAIRDKFDVTFSEFLRALMKLEMQGIIYVNVLKENLRNVELIAKS